MICCKKKKIIKIYFLKGKEKKKQKPCGKKIPKISKNFPFFDELLKF